MTPEQKLHLALQNPKQWFVEYQLPMLINEQVCIGTHYIRASVRDIIAVERHLRPETLPEDAVINYMTVNYGVLIPESSFAKKAIESDEYAASLSTSTNPQP